ncbi:MAG: hypothetical protein AAB309_02530, partial [Deltaproteobacteria bacterium]
MKVKLYIEKILKVAMGVCGFALFTFTTTHLLAGGTEDSLFEALSEGGSLNGSPTSDEKGRRGIETRALEMRLSETLWNSSEAASEDAVSQFIRDKIDLFKNENSSDLRFAKEDYFDDFKEKYEKGNEDKVARDILKENKESKIERIALAAERGEGRRAEKAERNEDKKAEKAEVKEDKKAEVKEEKKAEKKDNDNDK